MRATIAYGTPSAVFIGMALYELSNSLLLLYNRYRSSGRTLLWRLSIVTWFAIVFTVAIQLIALDYFMSPYELGSLGIWLAAGFGAAIIAAFLTVLLILYRVYMFYGKTHLGTMAMTVLALVVVVMKAIGNGQGVLMSIGFQRNKSFDGGLITRMAAANALGTLGEAIYSTLGSIAFLHALTDSKSKWTFFRRLMFKEIGRRLAAIFLLNVIIAVFSIWLIRDDNHISHTSYYLTSYAYALQLHTFLDLSYVSAKEIILEQLNQSTSNDKSLPM
jgi:hypothetical protein